MNINSRQIVLLERPVGVPDESAFGIENTVVSGSLAAGEIRLHGLYYSVDPYIRVRMNDQESHIAPFALHKPMEGNVIARVAESKSYGFARGDLVFGQLPWATDMVISPSKVKKINLRDSLASEYLGVLGLTGLTAYFGLLKIGQPQSGDTVVISGAAGAVGSVAGQIAKIKGCRVIGIVGSDEKCELITSRFKFDAAINYKTARNLDAEIKLSCPNGVDIYFDNVGGPLSDASKYEES
jgi:NADPH-dependent curcumin reductase CurA